MQSNKILFYREEREDKKSFFVFFVVVNNKKGSDTRTLHFHHSTFEVGRSMFDVHLRSPTPVTSICAKNAVVEDKDSIADSSY